MGKRPHLGFPKSDEASGIDTLYPPAAGERRHWSSGSRNSKRVHVPNSSAGRWCPAIGLPGKAGQQPSKGPPS